MQKSIQLMSNIKITCSNTLAMFFKVTSSSLSKCNTFFLPVRESQVAKKNMFETERERTTASWRSGKTPGKRDEKSESCICRLLLDVENELKNVVGVITYTKRVGYLIKLCLLFHYVTVIASLVNEKTNKSMTMRIIESKSWKAITEA